MSFLESRQFSLFSAMRHNFSVLFHLEIYILYTKGAIKVQIFRLSTATPLKFNQIPYVILQAASQFSFTFCNTLQCHDTVSETYALDKKRPSKYNFLDF